MIIRPANIGDLDEILAIYNDAILNSTALWSDDPVKRADREQWFAANEARGHPVFVAENEGRVAGYASYGPWQTRSGYRNTVESSVYIRAEHHGLGIGGRLLTALIDHARSAGLHVMIADIESGNMASIALHQKLGFQHCGFIPEVGTKYGRWLDLTVMRLHLGGSDGIGLLQPQ